MTNGIVRSFRLSEAGYKALLEESQRRNITLNAMLDHVCMEFASYDRYLPVTRSMKVPEDVWRITIESVPEEKLPEIARAWSDFTRSMVIFRRGSLTVEGIVEEMKLWRSANNMEMNEKMSGEKLTLMLPSLVRNGPRMTVFYQHIIRYMFEGLNAKVKCTVSGNVATVEISPVNTPPISA